MSNQIEMPWHDSAEDATAAAIHKSGKPLKAVAAELWPASSMETAYARLRGCLNENRPEKLSADEHIQIARITGRFDYLYYTAAQLHHSQPEQVTPADEAAQLQREFIESVKVQKRLAEQLQALRKLPV